MKEFVGKMLELGAELDQAASKMEAIIIIDEAQKLYIDHVRKMKKPTIKELIKDLKVLDIETNTIHELSYIDFNENSVGMKSDEYGHTSNSIDKVKFIRE